MKYLRAGFEILWAVAFVNPMISLIAHLTHDVRQVQRFILWACWDEESREWMRERFREDLTDDSRTVISRDMTRRVLFWDDLRFGFWSVICLSIAWLWLFRMPVVGALLGLVLYLVARISSQNIAGSGK